MSFIFEYRFEIILAIFVFFLGMMVGAQVVCRKLRKEASELTNMVKQLEELRKKLDERQELLKTQERRRRATGNLTLAR